MVNNDTTVATVGNYDIVYNIPSKKYKVVCGITGIESQELFETVVEAVALAKDYTEQDTATEADYRLSSS